MKCIIEEYDVDGNDSLDFSEFLMLTAKLDPRIGQEIEINKAFKLFDKDNNGYITRYVTEAKFNHVASFDFVTEPVFKLFVTNIKIWLFGL